MALWREMKLVYFGVGGLRYWIITVVFVAALWVETAFFMALGG